VGATGGLRPARAGSGKGDCAQAPPAARAIPRAPAGAGAAMAKAERPRRK